MLKGASIRAAAKWVRIEVVSVSSSTLTESTFDRKTQAFKMGMRLHQYGTDESPHVVSVEMDKEFLPYEKPTLACSAAKREAGR